MDNSYSSDSSEDIGRADVESPAPPATTSAAAPVPDSEEALEGAVANDVADTDAPSEFRATVKELVEKVMPDETDKVDDLIKEYEGREAVLLDTLRAMSEDETLVRQFDKEAFPAVTPNRDQLPLEGAKAMASVPEAPRWRFVNIAKKSMGYGSHHAGSYVEGQSSNDLGAKYVAPDVSLYGPARERAEVGKGDYNLPVYGSFHKDGAEVGRLGEGSPAADADLEENEVGKLRVTQLRQMETINPSGDFGGLPRPDPRAPAPRHPFREWDVNIELAPKKPREHEWHDHDAKDNYRMPGWGSSGRTPGGVGKIGFHGPNAAGEEFDGTFSRGGPGRDGADGDAGSESVGSYGEAREGYLFGRHGSASSAVAKSDGGSGSFLASPDGKSYYGKKRVLLPLLCCIPLLLAAIIAVALITKSEGEAARAAAAVGGVMLPPPLIVAINETNATSYPSSSPSEANESPQPSSSRSSIPTMSPTPQKSTGQPTDRPAPQASCSKERDFNLCIAVDMSGSVCNDGTGSECSDCRSSFLPMFFTSECRDLFVDEDTCCNNFSRVKDFAARTVELLGDFPANKDFSVVEFSTNARVINGLSSAETTSPAIERLDYTGGLTNHAAAIRTCQGTLPPSSGIRKNFIVLVTDGTPTVPQYDPEGAAEDAAVDAELDGTFIIPVFISPRGNDWSALAFMRRLSGDGRVFDVTDFDSLESLQGRLVDQVSCSYGEGV